MTTLSELYAEIYECGQLMDNLTDFGKRLAKVTGRARPYSARYLRSLMNHDNGFDRPSKELQLALDTLAAMLDNQHPLSVSYKEVSVLAVGEVKPGSLILGSAIQCAYPPCRIWFVPRCWNGKYCCRQHAEEMRKLR